MDVVQAGRVELRHLRAFEAMARLESFTQAAQELSITQPALSRTIQQLEGALGVRLLDRTSRHVVITPAGRVFLEYVEGPGGVGTRFRRRAQAGGHPPGVQLAPADPWAQNTVARFERATRTTISLVRTDDTLGAVRQGRVDVALVRGHVPATAVRVVHLFDEPRVAVCSVHSPLAKRTELDWAEVPRWPLVVNTASGTTGPWSWPEGAGPQRIVETTNFDEWIESVAADRGIGVIPDVAVATAAEL
jgi:DNA-binding transcriptional LysR family regulator